MRADPAPDQNPARRTIDAHNIRQIGQASLIYANDNREHLPAATVADGDGQRPATIHDVARLLALKGGMNDASLWFSRYDKALSGGEQKFDTVLDRERKGLKSDFAAQQVFSFDYVTGLRTSDPSNTPIAWTRGLREDGTWDSAGVYGADGGYILFLGGNVAFYSNLGSGATARLGGNDGEPASNIRDTLPPGSRVVGSGPATLDGMMGHSKPPKER